MNDESKRRQEFIDSLKAKGLEIDENGMIVRKDNLPLLKLWMSENFMCIFSFGNGTLEHVTDKELMETKQMFKTCKELRERSSDEQVLFRYAFTFLTHNLKIHLARLRGSKAVTKGRQLAEIVMNETIDPLLELAMQTGLPYDFTQNPIIEEKITVFAGSKKQPKAPEGFKKAAKVLHEKFNKLNGKKQGIPDFACSVAFQVDYWLKKFMPGITTIAIIRDLFTAIDLAEYDTDITQIHKYIKRGKKYFSK